MELSQSQDLCSEATNSHRGNNGYVASLPEEERVSKSGRTDVYSTSLMILDACTASVVLFGAQLSDLQFLLLSAGAAAPASGESGQREAIEVRASPSAAAATSWRLPSRDCVVTSSPSISHPGPR